MTNRLPCGPGIGRLAAAAAVLGALVLSGALVATPSGPALAQGQAALVKVDEVTVEPLSQTVDVIGRLVARRAGEVSARIGGPVERFLVEVGDRVEQDQVVAELNAARLQALRDSAASSLDAAKAGLATKRAELELAQQELKRLEGLKRSAAFSQANYEDTQRRVEIAEAAIAEARAAIAIAEAELALREIDLAYSRIRAPYGGVVTQRLTEVGAYVQTGSPVIYMLSDQELEIEADVPVRRLAGLRPGTTVRFRLDDETLYRATVRAIVPAENPLTRTRPVRFVPRFAERLPALANDQSVVVQVPVGPPREVVTVHKDAVLKRPDGDLVFVVVDGTAQPRPVSLGEAIGGRLEVLGGLEPGEAVVVRGNERLQPGAPVRINGAS